MQLISSGYGAGIEDRLVDQGRSERFALKLPVLVVREGKRPVCNMGETSNVSSSGVLMALQTPIAPGELIEYFIQLAAPVEDRQAVRLHCRGRVMRREGLICAATIERYEFLRDERSGLTKPLAPDE